MNLRIGIRREDKNEWERRAPLTPRDVEKLRREQSIEVWLQPSPIRIFTDDEYRRAGAIVSEDLCPCSLILGIKEMPLDFFRPGKAYFFFSHVIKGQKYNMPMLKKMMELGCHLLDYELVKDDSGRRLIFFGRHAGLAGMINTLWAYGKRMEWEGVPNPFSEIKLAHQYSGLEEAKAHIFDIGERIWKVGLPQILTPFICGFTGYGHVSQGAQEIFDLLPNQEITPEEIISVSTLLPAAQEVLIKVVFKEQDMFVPLKREEAFDLQDYYDNPHKYRSRFEYYLPHLSIMVNCIYWSNKYPRLVTNEFLKKAYSLPHPQFPKVIGDISCDIEGSVQCTVKATNPGAPVFVYNPLDATVSEGFEGFGPVIMAVDNLPCEIPQESSQFFSDILTPFIPQLAKADFNHSGKELNLSPELVRSIILHQGKLIPEFQYLQKYL